jgi:hypothetical protein
MALRLAHLMSEIYNNHWTLCCQAVATTLFLVESTLSDLMNLSRMGDPVAGSAIGLFN